MGTWPAGHPHRKPPLQRLSPAADQAATASGSELEGTAAAAARATATGGPDYWSRFAYASSFHQWRLEMAMSIVESGLPIVNASSVTFRRSGGKSEA